MWYPFNRPEVKKDQWHICSGGFDSQLWSVKINVHDQILTNVRLFFGSSGVWSNF